MLANAVAVHLPHSLLYLSFGPPGIAQNESGVLDADFQMALTPIRVEGVTLNGAQAFVWELRFLLLIHTSTIPFPPHTG